MQAATDASSSAMQSVLDNEIGLVAGIHASASNSSWSMAYGLQDNHGKYCMLDTQAAGYNAAKKAATDINEIAKNAQAESSHCHHGHEVGFSEYSNGDAFGNHLFDLAMLVTFFVAIQQAYVLIANDKQGRVLGHSVRRLASGSCCHVCRVASWN